MKISIEKILKYAIDYIETDVSKNYKRGWYDTDEQEAIAYAQKQVMENIKYLLCSVQEKLEDGDFDIEVERTEVTDDVV